MPDTIEQLKHEHEVRQEGEKQALHARNAVLVIDVSVVLFVISCSAVILVVLFR